MKLNWKRWSMAAAGLALLALPLSAFAQGKSPGPNPGPNQAFLYEISETATLLGVDLNCVLTGGAVCSTPTPVPLAPSATSPTSLVVAGTATPAFPTARTAVAQLQGVASVGSPLCQAEFLVTNPRTDTCTVIATGTDDVGLEVDLATGAIVPTTGTLAGTFDVTVQLDNSVDSPEWSLETGAFYGSIAFGAPGVPIGTAVGFFVVGGTIEQARACTTASATCLAFTAAFRQPFATGGGKSGKAKTKPRRNENAFYLLDDGKHEPVRQDERATGWATVRFEVTFP